MYVVPVSHTGQGRQDSILLEKLFSGAKAAEGGAFAPGTPSGPRTARHSTGWAQMLKFMKENNGGIVMDVGPTSSSNVNFLANLGCSIYLPDPLHDAATEDWTSAGEDGAPVLDTAKFLEEFFSFSGRTFDAVLLWDTLDFLPEPLLQPVIDRLHEVIRPEGKVLAFFNSKLEPSSAAHRRFHVTDSDQVASQAGAGYKQLRVLQNRNVEKLFHAYAASKFMLAADNMREVVITR
jgi:hypothetical protein